MIYLLSAVLCLAVTIMLSYHLWSISQGETSVEGQDHEVYRRKARARGEVRISDVTIVLRFPLNCRLQAFVNCYDLGYVPFSPIFISTFPEHL